MKEKIKKIILISTLIIIGVFLTHKTLAQQTAGAITFYASPQYISSGQSSVLILKYSTSEGSDSLVPGASCIKSGDASWINTGNNFVNGTFGTGPLTQTTTYTMTCQGGDINAYPPITKSVTVTIGTAPVGVSDIRPPTRGAEMLKLTAQNTTLEYGGSTTLTWEYTQSETSNELVIGNCSKGGVNWSGSDLPTKGTFNTGPLTETKTYTMHCWRTAGVGFSWDDRSITINVKPQERGSRSQNITGRTVQTESADNITATTAILRGRAGMDNTYKPGCTSSSGYSTTTGAICASEENTSFTDAIAYFRYSSSPISPVFCNDTYGTNMISTKDIPLGKVSYASFYQPIKNLTPDTDYYYCAVVSNKKGIAYESGQNVVKHFHTNCYETTANTKEATNIGPTSVILNGTYCSTKDVTTSFEYRKTRENSTTSQELPWQKAGEVIRSIGTKSNLSGNFSFKLSGLEPNKTYEFKAVVKTNTENPVTSVLEFTTNPPSAGSSNSDGGGFSFSSIFGSIFGGSGTNSGSSFGSGFGSSSTGVISGSSSGGNTGGSNSGTGGSGSGNTGSGSGVTPVDNINNGNVNSGIFNSGSFSGGNINNGNVQGAAISTSSGNIITGAALSGINVSGVSVSGGGNNITNGSVQNGTITSGKIVSGKITTGKLTSGDVNGTTVTGTVSGATITTPSGEVITGATISGITITGAVVDDDQNITDGEITSGNIESGSIKSGNITSGTLVGSVVTGGTISNGNISGAIITTTTNNIITGATLTGTTISGATIDSGGNISTGKIASGTMTSGTNAGKSSTANNGTWGSSSGGSGATSGTWGTGTGSGTWVATSGTGGGGFATWSGSGNGSGTWSSATGSGTWSNGTGTGGAGTGTWGNLVLGQRATPPNDAIVRYHEGIETVFTRQIINNPIYQTTYGYKTGDDLLTFAWNLSDQFARMFGYVDGKGKEIRVSYPDIAAYQLQLIGNKLTVYEYYAEKIVDIRNLTTVFKNASGYEYYFKK